jgi:P4 family phage/plasmid primase-like protien
MSQTYGKHGKKLVAFLKTHEQPPGSKYTHISAGNNYGTTGNYWIVENDIKELGQLIDKSLRENHMQFSIGEKPDNVGFILIDIDLHYDPPQEVLRNPMKLKTLKTIIPQEFLTDIAALYRNKLEQIFNTSTIDADKYGMHFFEKEHPTLVNGAIHDGFHALIEIACTKETQYYLREQCLKEIDDLLIKHDIKSKVKQKIDDIVDKRIINNAWMMYGCAKHTSLPYLLTSSYRFIQGKTTINRRSADTIAAMKETNLTERFSIQGRKQNVDYRNDDIIRDIKRYYEENISKKNKVILSKKSEERKTGTTLDTISRLVKILSVARADSRENWLHVGLCLKKLDESLMEDWVEFSKKSTKYTDGECDGLWASFKPSWMGYSIGSLYYWAKQDNEKLFYEIISDTVQGMIMNCVKGAGLQHYDVAMILYHYYKDKYVCTDPKNKIWYEFRGNMWKKITIGYSLTSKIPEHIGEECAKLAKEFTDKMLRSTDDTESKRYQSYLKEITNYTKHLRSDPFQKSVMNQSGMIFHREEDEFALKLDNNPSIIACTNGVIDLNASDEKSAFRQGTPDDLCSVSTKQAYIPYDKNSREIKGIKEFIKQVLPRRKVRHHFMKVISSLLYGRNEEEKFYILTGSGGNGKSKLVELITIALGDYSKPFNIALLQKKRGEAAGPNPALHKLKKARFIAASEPDKESGFNTGVMKEWSGGDKISSRTHHAEEEEWMPMFKMFLLCNDMPPLDSIDDGLIRRIEVIEFISKFVAKDKAGDDPDNPFQFPRKENLARKFEKWGPHFLSYMVHYYFTYYLTEKSTPPNCVIKSTKAYEAANDKIKQFMTENLKQDKKGSLTLKEINSNFRKWFISELGSFAKVPKKEELEKYLLNKFKKEFKPQTKKLMGYAFSVDLPDDFDENIETKSKSDEEEQNNPYIYDSDEEIGVQDDYLSDGNLRGKPRDPIASDSDQDTTYRDMVERKLRKERAKSEAASIAHTESANSERIAQKAKKQIGRNEHRLIRNRTVNSSSGDEDLNHDSDDSFARPIVPKKKNYISDIDVPSDSNNSISIPDGSKKSHIKTFMTDDSDTTNQSSIIPLQKKKISKMKIDNESTENEVPILGDFTDEGTSASEELFDLNKIRERALKTIEKQKKKNSIKGDSSDSSKKTEKIRASNERKKAALDRL